jgi:predicted Zn-dependent protease
MNQGKGAFARRDWLRRAVYGAITVAAMSNLAGCGQTAPPKAPTVAVAAPQTSLADLSSSYESARISAEQSPTNAELAVEAGVRASETGQFGEGLRWFQRAAALKPTLTTALTGQGQMWMALGRPGQAVKMYLKARKLEPEDIQLKLEIARAYTYLRDFDEAQRYIRSAEKQAPANPQVYQALSHILAETKDTPGSLKAAQHLCDLEPNNVESWNHYSRLLLRYQRYPEAEAALKKARALAPSSVTTDLLYAQALVEGRKTPAADTEAFAVLSRALTADPHNSGALLIQGQIQSRANNIPLAISLLRRAREYSPRSQAILLALGEALTRSGKTEQGAQLVKESQQIGPAVVPFSDLENTTRTNPNPALTIRLAEMYRSREMYDSAIHVLERSLKRQPGNTALRTKLAEVQAQANRELPTVL